MSNEFYVWDTEVEAQSALDFINSTEWFPLIGSDPTGNKRPDKQKTICWATNVLERLDGKWTFARIPSELLDYAGVPEEDREAFLTAFNPTIEVCDNYCEWFDCSDDEEE